MFQMNKHDTATLLILYFRPIHVDLDHCSIETISYNTDSLFSVSVFQIRAARPHKLASSTFLFLYTLTHTRTHGIKYRSEQNYM